MHTICMLYTHQHIITPTHHRTNTYNSNAASMTTLYERVCLCHAMQSTLELSLGSMQRANATSGVVGVDLLHAVNHALQPMLGVLVGDGVLRTHSGLVTTACKVCSTWVKYMVIVVVYICCMLHMYAVCCTCMLCPAHVCCCLAQKLAAPLHSPLCLASQKLAVVLYPMSLLSHQHMATHCPTNI